MALLNCNCKSNCTAAALIASTIIGVIAAFLQITGVITVSPVFLWAALGFAAVYLGILVATASRRADGCAKLCTALNALLVGILGTILFSVVLLAVGIVATSIVSALLVGLLLFFLALTVTSSACYVRYAGRCGS